MTKKDKRVVKISKKYGDGERCYWFSSPFKAASYIGAFTQHVYDTLENPKKTEYNGWKIEYDDDMKDKDEIDLYTGYNTANGYYSEAKHKKKITLLDYIDKMVYNIDDKKNKVEYVTDKEIAEYKRNEYVFEPVFIKEKMIRISDFDPDYVEDK